MIDVTGCYFWLRSCDRDQGLKITINNNNNNIKWKESDNKTQGESCPTLLAIAKDSIINSHNKSCTTKIIKLEGLAFNQILG